MINRVQIGYPAVMKVLEKPKRIEIGKFLIKTKKTLEKTLFNYKPSKIRTFIF